MNGKVPVVLTVAGFDPSSGAGITADLKTIAAHGMYGVCCPTILTVQSTLGVFGSQPMQPSYVAATLACLAQDSAFAAIKIGALGDTSLLREIVNWLRQSAPGLPVVLDPVLLSSSGHPLLEVQAIQLLCEQLLPLVTVITPNVAEAAALLGRPLLDRAAVVQAATDLLMHLGPLSDQQERAVVITGGDTQTGGTPDDYLHAANGGTWLHGEWVDTRSTHGTGCAFSTAIACNLAAGRSVEQAVQQAKSYVRHALLHAYPVGSRNGHGPLHHLFACDRSRPAAITPADSNET